MKRKATLLLICLLGTICLQAQEVKFHKANKPVTDSYIVVLKDNTIQPLGNDLNTSIDLLNSKYGGKVTNIFENAVKGYSVKMSSAQAKLLSQDPEVAFVEEDGYATIIQSTVPWGLDRIDQRNLPLDGSFGYYSSGSGVYAYILDTGILASHTEFGNRAAVAVDFINDGQNGNDCNGHGTAVAGVIGATTYGVAKNAQLRAVRVADCSGYATFSNIVAGLNWVISNRSNPAVVNISLGDGGISTAVDTAVNNTVNSGVTVVAAAGNLNQNACDHSPARASGAVTVAASDQTDTRWTLKNYGSNYGSCIDVFAPGADITTTWNQSTTSIVTGSGTSFAAPFAAGVAALYLSSIISSSSIDASSAIINLATTNVVSDTQGSPNRLLYTRFGNNSSTVINSSTGGCVYSSTVTAGDGGFSGSFATGYGPNPYLSIEKNVSGSWYTVASIYGTHLYYAGLGGTFRFKAVPILPEDMDGLLLPFPILILKTVFRGQI